MTTNTAARRLLTCAAIIGAITAGGAGLAAAEPHGGPSDPRNGSGDTTGWHHIDPRGYHHRDRSPLRENEHNNALREYYQRQSQPAPSQTGTGDNGSSSWSQVQRPDGSGYTVCRPQASWCQ